MSLDELPRLLRQVRLALQNEDYPLAIQGLEEIVVIARARGDIGSEARHLGNLALTYHRHGQPEKSLETFVTALECARRDDDTFTQSGLLGNMGNILRELGRLEEADKRLKEALSLSEKLDDRRGRGIWLSNLGLVYDDLKDYPGAIRYHREAVNLARELFDQPGLAARLANLGSSQAMARMLQDAIASLEEAAALYDQLGRTHDLMIQLVFLADLHAHLAQQTNDPAQRGDYLIASLGHYDRALKLARSLEDTAVQAELLHRIANVMLIAEKHEDAHEYLQKAQTMFDSLGMKQWSKHNRQMLERLVDFLKQQGNP